MSATLIARLSRLKQRLALSEFQLEHDALLTAFLEALTGRFDSECHRSLLRQVDDVYEFPADDLEIRVPAYPVESVARFELKENEITGWQLCPDAEFVVRKSGVISLGSALGSYLDQARVVYTGGYVPPGTPAAPGQSPLPAVLEHAAVEQAAFWFQNRDRLGLARAWDYHGTYRQFGSLDLMPSVAASLEKYERWTI